MHHDGWVKAEDDDQVEDLAGELLDVADSYPVGAVLGIRLDQVEWR